MTVHLLFEVKTVPCVQIAAAYEVLADDEKRKLYDQVNDAAVQDSSVLGFVLTFVQLFCSDLLT